MLQIRTLGLNAGVLNSVETLAQSIAGLAPTCTPAMIVPLVYSQSGNGSWLVFLVATIGLLFTVLCLNQFSKRLSSPGSLYTYAAIGLGSAAGKITGLAILFAYIMGGAAALIGFCNFFIPLLNALDVSVSPVLSAIGCMLIAWLIAYRDIKLSAGVMLCLELLSMGIVLALIFVILGHYGLHIDKAQLALRGVAPENFRLGLVMAIFCFVGFESAATLGEEAKSALTSIPQAMMLSVIFMGIFFALASYAEIIGFTGIKESLSTSNAPLQTLANISGFPILSVAIDIGASISFFSCVISCINSAGRILYFMSHDGVIHSSLKQTHAHNRTPHVATSISALSMLLPTIILLVMNFKILDIYGWLGTVCTYGFITAYIIACIAAPFYLSKLNIPYTTAVVLAVVSVSFMSLALFGNIYPVPTAPYNYLPYIFVGYMVIGILLLLLSKPRYHMTQEFLADSLQQSLENQFSLRDSVKK